MITTTGLQQFDCLMPQPKARTLEDRTEEQGEHGGRETGDKKHIAPRVVRRADHETSIALEGDDQLDDTLHGNRDRLGQHRSAVRRRGDLRRSLPARNG